MTELFRFFLIIMTFISSVSIMAATSVDVLFCAYDMGESNAFNKLMSELDKQKITYKILALGKSLDVFNQHPNLIKIDLPDVKSNREQTLGSDHLELIKNTVHPKIIIAGMSSVVQAQLLNSFRDAAYTVAFYDNFDDPESKEYIQPFLKTIGKIDEYFLPSETTLPGFQRSDVTRLAKLSVLGQPVLEDWDDTFVKTDKLELRSRLHVSSMDKVLLFVGGYDDTYKDYFRLFVKAMKSFETDSDLKVFVTYHPKTKGEAEKLIITEEGARNIKIIEQDGPSTAQIATISDVLLCHKSSVGIQALYIGLPVVYVVKKGDLNNFAINQGLAYEVEDLETLTDTVKNILSAANSNKAPLKSLGIPKEATKKITERIKTLLLS